MINLLSDCGCRWRIDAKRESIQQSVDKRMLDGHLVVGGATGHLDRI